MFELNNGVSSFDDELDELGSNVFGTFGKILTAPMAISEKIGSTIGGAIGGKEGAKWGGRIGGFAGAGGSPSHYLTGKAIQDPRAAAKILGSAGRSIGQATGLMRPSISTSSTAVPLSIASDPETKALLAKINGQLSLTKLQTEATQEHREMVRRDNFERSVLRKLELLQSSLIIPYGVRRDNIIKLIARTA